MTELRVHLLPECLINPPPAPREGAAMRGLGAALLGIFAPKLIENAISGIGTAIRKAGEKDTEQVAAEEFANLYVANDKQALIPNAELGCVLGVWFEGRDDGPAKEDPVAQQLKAGGFVPKDSVVGGVFEAAIRRAPDQTAFFLDTRYFRVWDLIGDKNKGERDYVVTLAVSTPGASAEGDTFALGKINFGRQGMNEVLIPMQHPLDTYPWYRSNLMPWSKISKMSKEAYDQDVAAGQAAGKRYMPVTFDLTVSATDDGNQFLVRLGTLLGGAAGEVAGEISKRILPAEIEKAAAEDAANAEKLYQKELEAEMEVRKAQQAYDDAAPEKKPALEIALEIAKRKLAWQTRLREAAGLEPPQRQ